MEVYDGRQILFTVPPVVSSFARQEVSPVVPPRIDDPVSSSSERLDARPANGVGRLPRRTVTSGLVGGGALAALVAALGARPTQGAAQESTPVAVTDFEELGLTVGPLFGIRVEDLPPPPVEVSLARVTSQPGDGDLEDYFTFPGPVAFIVESGRIICRCGTAESPCIILRSEGPNEPAPPVPADIPLGPGEGLYIPTNTPDSFANPGPDPQSELDLTIWPVGAQATPAAGPAT
jgi:hypothetical protein